MGAEVSRWLSCFYRHPGWVGASCPALCRASTTFFVPRRQSRPCAGHPRLSGFAKIKDVDGRDIGVRKHAVLRTAMPGHDEWRVCASCLSPFVPAPAFAGAGCSGDPSRWLPTSHRSSPRKRGPRAKKLDPRLRGDERSFDVQCNPPVMPALCRGHPRLSGFAKIKDVNGRDKPGHDGDSACNNFRSFPRKRESRATTSKFAIFCAGSPLSRGRTELVGAPAQSLHCHARPCAGHPRLHYYDVNRFGGVAILHRLPADFRFFVFVQSLVVSAQVSTRRPS
jgi:hypothetical protein